MVGTPMSSTDVGSFPEFIRSSSSGVRFDSPFPPLNPKVRVKGVYERAGFDVYKGDRPRGSRTHSSYQRNSSNSSQSLSASVSASARNFTAPVGPTSNKQKTMSDPSFSLRDAASARSSGGSKIRDIYESRNSPGQFARSKLSETDSLKKGSFSSAESEHEPLRIPKSRQAQTSSHSLLNSTNTISSTSTTPEAAEKDKLDFSPGQNTRDVHSNSTIFEKSRESDTLSLYAPASLTNQKRQMAMGEDSGLQIHSAEAESDDDDYVKQLLNMKKQFQSDDLDLPSIVVQDSNGVSSKPRIFSGDFNVYSPPAPSTFTRFHRDSGMSMASSVYTMDAGQKVTSVGTMHTDDPKIYNLEVKREPSSKSRNSTEADMSAIQEVTEEDLEDLHSHKTNKTAQVATGSILDDLRRMRLQDSHSTLAQDFEDAEEYPSASINTSSFQQTASESTLYENEFLPKSQNPAGQGPCRKCGLEIEGNTKSIWSKDSQLSGQWHRKCFGCQTCAKPFSKGTSCYVFKDQPYCEHHFHEVNGSICNSCSTGIEGNCLETDNGLKFHPGCLVCSVCQTSIKEDYYLLDDRMICEQDAMRMRYEGDSAPTSRLERRRTRTVRV
ncbi:unnamed protein product [Kuraishia capsulata CBS 1993]|uniref:LIM zinc-binding domain-containing protein n=1 Tax=Kuraishia capsulata CBS 1993 TaxID=1382522 RepID=W6MFP4_9ASCO|nr:uncharacterized protein KUCA_T00000153001 [Kuraishia capsulata CBS 1993]CDK24193.1 unnamed protein product [Kuraishia capsulata CBS 1993]